MLKIGIISINIKLIHFRSLVHENICKSSSRSCQYQSIIAILIKSSTRGIQDGVFEEDNIHPLKDIIKNSVVFANEQKCVRANVSLGNVPIV